MARFNIPPLTRGLFLALILLTLLNAVLIPGGAGFKPITRIGNGTPYLSLIPGISYRFPWTFATASLVEQNIFGLVITGLVIFFGGRYLERAFGSSEYAKFVLFSTVLPNVLAFIFYYFLFLVSRSDKALTATISGGISIQASFLVAFKQLVPEHTVSLAKGIIKMRVKHFPAIFLVANTLSGIIIGTETAMFLAWLGFFISWIYLRFYRVSPMSGLVGSSAPDADSSASTVKGDASDTFAFAEFFPDVMKGSISSVTDKIWEVACTLGVCTPFSADDIESGNAQASARADGRGSSPAGMGRGAGNSARREEAERRRALALKALDERLRGVTAPRSSSAAPSATSTDGLAPSSANVTDDKVNV